jgi:hypothetical protein
MIKLKALEKVLRAGLSTHPYFCVRDMSKNMLYLIDEGTDGEANLQELMDILPDFNNYGKVLVYSGAERHIKNSFQRGNQYTVELEREERGISRQQTGAIGYGSVPPGYRLVPLEGNGLISGEVQKVNNDMFELRLKQMEKEFEWKKQEYLRKDDDPIAKYGMFAPIALSVMGKTPEEIQSLMGLCGQAKAAINGIDPKTVTNSLPAGPDFGELKGMTPEQLEIKLNALLESVATKISTQEMILLCQAVNTAPQFAFLLGTLAQKVDPKVLVQLLTGLIKDPSLAQKALNFI